MPLRSEPLNLNIEEQKHYRISFLHMGFRPFFLLGSLFAVFSVIIWFLQYHFQWLMPQISNLPVVIWHGHEMIYGYAMAIIAGFLLTAARNWTNVQTLHGWPLMLLVLLWLLARLMPFTGLAFAIPMMALLDISFSVFLCIAILHPIIKAHQWTQLGICVKLVLLILANLLFYFGLIGQVQGGMEMGLYAGLYLVISLILLMAGRVIPFFIEKGVDEQVELNTYLWLDVAGIVLMLVFIVLQVFSPFHNWAATLAFALCLLHSLRLLGWYTPGIWRKPLLWILYIAYAAITLGFGLTALADIGYLNPMLATHAFGFGGIGLMTLGMMARVALGHTGRNVFDPPSILRWIFLAVILGMVARIGLPMLLPGFYSLWMGISQVLWILAFGVFSWVYAPMLIMPRVDGRYG